MIITAEDAAFATAVVAEVRDQLGAAACSLALVDGDELVFSAASGIGADQIIGLQLPLDRGLAGYVVVSGQAIAIGDVSADRRFDLETAESTGFVPITILAVPLEDDDGAFGVIEVLDRTPSAHDLEVVAEAAQRIADRISRPAAAPALPQLLADPRLAELLPLIAELRDRDAADRDRAAAALRAVLEQPR